jgi:dTDP-4-amino-4,6-dideoxygalactose transaminase
MDRINAIARKHDLKVIEDACESHGGEWKGGKVGNLGDLGCFSFQTGKSLTCGEGGAILGRDQQLIDRCYSFHNFGRARGSVRPKRGQHYAMVATKCRMAEYQAAILISQMEKFEAQCKRRSENAAYLTEKLAQIPGIVPREDYPNVTRKAFYYYGLRYQQEQFDGLSRGQFVAALGAEGIRASTSLGVLSDTPMNREGCLDDAFQSKAYQMSYPREKLANYQAENECPACDQLIEETVGFHQSMLLGPRQDMDDIADAVGKIYEYRRKLAAAG